MYRSEHLNFIVPVVKLFKKVGVLFAVGSSPYMLGP